MKMKKMCLLILVFLALGIGQVEAADVKKLSPNMLAYLQKKPNYAKAMKGKRPLVIYASNIVVPGCPYWTAFSKEMRKISQNKKLQQKLHFFPEKRAQSGILTTEQEVEFHDNCEILCIIEPTVKKIYSHPSNSTEGLMDLMKNVAGIP